MKAPRLPVRAYEDRQAFKLFGSDVGLLGAAAGLEAAALVRGNAAFVEFKGALTEQYVVQELTALDRYDPHYWTSEAGAAEVDFVLVDGERMLPLESKAEINLKAKSLRVYREKYAPEIALRASMAPFELQPGLVNIPLYAMGALPAVLESLRALN
jgi:predicted AAA+ superfamily ATPase